MTASTNDGERAVDSAEQLRISEERHRLLAEHANDVIWTMSPDGTITYVSPAVFQMRGITPEEACAQTLDQIQTPESAAITMGYFRRLYERLAQGLEPEQFVGQLEYYRKDGSTVWTEVRVIPHMDTDGTLIELLGVTRDISERKRYEDELQRAHDEVTAANAELAALNRQLSDANTELKRLATTDHLTGVWNRRHTEDALGAEISQAQRHGYPLALVLFDIDMFKEINDTWGHDAGDRAIVHVATTIASRLRAGDLIGRWGGDEFLIVLPYTGLQDAQMFAEQFRAHLAEKDLPAMGSLTISAGTAELRDGDTLDSLLQRADAALYQAKAAGRNCVSGDA